MPTAPRLKAVRLSLVFDDDLVGLLGLDFLRGTRLIIDFKRGIVDLGK